MSDSTSIYREDYELMSLAGYLANAELSEYGRKNFPVPQKVSDARSADIYTYKSRGKVSNQLTKLGKKVMMNARKEAKKADRIGA